MHCSVATIIRIHCEIALTAEDGANPCRQRARLGSLQPTLRRRVVGIEFQRLLKV